jgi:hypothetical protein
MPAGGEQLIESHLQSDLGRILTRLI